MKDRNSSSSSNHNNGNNNSTNTATPNIKESNKNLSDSQNSFLSPYSAGNFMSPPVGGIVKCITCLGDTIQGKVMAYDQQTKMLSLSIKQKHFKTF
jgi:hypothetical protein